MGGTWVHGHMGAQVHGCMGADDIPCQSVLHLSSSNAVLLKTAVLLLRGRSGVPRYDTHRQVKHTPDQLLKIALLVQLWTSKAPRCMRATDS